MPRKRGTLLDKLLDKYPNHPLLKRLLDKMTEFFVLLDALDSSGHDKIFSALFIEGKKTCEVAEDNYIHEETIREYTRNDYSKVAKKMIQMDYVRGLKKTFGNDINL